MACLMTTLFYVKLTDCVARWFADLNLNDLLVVWLACYLSFWMLDWPSP